MNLTLHGHGSLKINPGKFEPKGDESKYIVVLTHICPVVRRSDQIHEHSLMAFMSQLFDSGTWQFVALFRDQIDWGNVLPECMFAFPQPCEMDFELLIFFNVRTTCKWWGAQRRCKTFSNR